MSSLQSGADTETFLDKMLGTNCYSRAVAELQKDCGGLNQVQKTRLALHLTNCQLATQGQRTYPCSQNEHLRVCMDRLPDRENSLYIEFLTHVDSMCLFIQNQQFEKYTETMLNTLSEGAGFARDQLAAVGARTLEVSKDVGAIRTATEDAVVRLREQRELQLAAMDAVRQYRTESAAKFADLSEQQRAALHLAERQLELGKELEAATEGVERRVTAGQLQIENLFGSLGEKALEIGHAQEMAAAAQRELGTQLKGLSDGSKGLRAAVDTVSEYQRRSDAALIKLLGRSYTLEDAAFYGAGVVAAVAAGASKVTSGARLPVIALLSVNVIAERMLLDKFHLWLDVDSRGEVMVTLPMPSWLHYYSGDPLAFNFKWALRKVCAALCGLLVLGTIFSYRDYERATYRRLEQIHEDIKDMQRRHEEESRMYRDELLRARTDVLARIGGGDGDGGGNSRQRQQQQAAAAADHAFFQHRQQQHNPDVSLLPSPEQPPEKAQLRGAGGGGGGEKIGGVISTAHRQILLENAEEEKNIEEDGNTVQKTKKTTRSSRKRTISSSLEGGDGSHNEEEKEVPLPARRPRRRTRSASYDDEQANEMSHLQPSMKQRGRPKRGREAVVDGGAEMKKNTKRRT